MMLDYSLSDDRKNPTVKRAEGLLMGCPICDGKAEIWYHPDKYEPDRPFVKCSKCGLSSSDTYYTTHHGWSLAFAKLIVWWNTRTSLPFDLRSKWKGLGEKFDETWKIPFYSDKFFEDVFAQMEELRKEW